LDKIVEALLFASEESLSAERIAGALERQDATPAAVRETVAQLNRLYRESGRAFEIVEVAGGYKMLTLPEFNNYVRRLLRSRTRERLSQAALETLAIVAYRQPITRAEIDNIRGVDSGPLLRAMVDRGLIRIIGRQESLGHPLLYGTTKLFLELFGLKDLESLPKADELAKMTAEEVAKEDLGEAPAAGGDGAVPGESQAPPSGEEVQAGAEVAPPSASPAVARAMETLAEEDAFAQPETEAGAETDDDSPENIIRLPQPKAAPDGPPTSDNQS
jgi:segregation and condensation protein B